MSDEGPHAADDPLPTLTTRERNVCIYFRRYHEMPWWSGHGEDAVLVEKLRVLEAAGVEVDVTVGTPYPLMPAERAPASSTAPGRVTFS